MKIYQSNYASKRPQMYEYASRTQKAKQIVALIIHHLGIKNFKKAIVLDIGASSGIIDNYLSKYCKKLIGVDIDQKAIIYAKKNFSGKNLTFMQGDAMKLNFSNRSFDVVICAHVYEHVPDTQQLFREIKRVLKNGGVCYLAAANALWPIEPHYNLPFLSMLPKNFANIYLRIFKNIPYYYENLLSYWGLNKLLLGYRIYDYTASILQSPRKFAFVKLSKPKYRQIFCRLISPLSTYFSPTFFWILEKS